MAPAQGQKNRGVAHVFKLFRDPKLSHHNVTRRNFFFPFRGIYREWWVLTPSILIITSRYNANPTFMLRTWGLHTDVHQLWIKQEEKSMPSAWTFQWATNIFQVSIHTPVSLISLYLVTPPFCTWEHFLPGIKVRESFPQGQLSESSIRSLRLEIQKFLRRRTHPLFDAFLRNSSMTTTKRHAGDLSAWRVRSLLCEQVLSALRSRCYPHISSVRCPIHLQTGNRRKRCLKNMKSSPAWWEIFIPE